MAFTVEPHALDSFAGLVSRAGDDIAATRRYLEKYAIPDDWPGALSSGVGAAARAAMDSAIEATGKASAVLYVSADGMRQAAAYYRETDVAAAAGFDAVLPGREAAAATAEEQAWAATGITPTFNDVQEPQGRLAAVGEVEYSHPLAPLDYLSPAHHVIAVWEWLFGTNPLNDTLESVAGDWQALAHAGVALGNAADALDDLAQNLQGGAVALHPAWWQGHAAESAYQFFARTAQAVVDALVVPMRDLSARFAEVSVGIWNYCEAASGFIKGLIDGAIVVALAGAGAAATAPSGVGPLAAGGAALLTLATMLNTWARWTSTGQLIYGGVQATLGIIQSNTSDLGGATLPSLDGGGYAHPLVT